MMLRSSFPLPATGLLCLLAVGCSDAPGDPTAFTTAPEDLLPRLHVGVGTVPNPSRGLSALAAGVPTALGRVSATRSATSTSARRYLWAQNPGGSAYRFEFEGTTYVGSNSLANPSHGAQRLVAVGDFAGDATDDLVYEWTGGDGDNGRGVLVDSQNPNCSFCDARWGVVPREWHIVGAGDYDSDGHTDLLWENTNTGARAVWTIVDLVVINAPLIGTVSTDWHMVAADDLDGDGKADILLENTVSGAKVLWMMDGHGRVKNSTLLGILPLEWRLSTTVDMNNDGHADILWENTSTGAKVVWFEDGVSGRVTGSQQIPTGSPLGQPLMHVFAASK